MNDVDALLPVSKRVAARRSSTCGKTRNVHLDIHVEYDSATDRAFYRISEWHKAIVGQHWRPKIFYNDFIPTRGPGTQACTTTRPGIVWCASSTAWDLR